LCGLLRTSGKDEEGDRGRLSFTSLLKGARENMFGNRERAENKIVESGVSGEKVQGPLWKRGACQRPRNCLTLPREPTSEGKGNTIKEEKGEFLGFDGCTARRGGS